MPPGDIAREDLPPGDEGAALLEALATLRAHREGTLAFDEHVRPVRFVQDPEDGRLIFPAMVAMLDASEVVLFVPEESDEALQLLLTLEPVDEASHPGPDRWRIHHDQPTDIHWVAAWVDGARRGKFVFDGDAMMAPNPLASCEAALCRRANADEGALLRAADRATGRRNRAAVCVGVDPWGLHARCEFDVARVPFALDDAPAGSCEQAERAVEHLLVRSDE